MNYTILLPKIDTCEAVFKAPLRLAFDPLVIDFIGSVSDALLAHPRIRDYSELVALGFWMRRASLLRFKEMFYSRNGNEMYPRGVAFHIAPSNVDTIFVYSWFLSMLSGNSNIVRISRSSEEQVFLLLDILGKVLEENCFESLRPSILVVQYGHDDEVSSYFSARCDLRIIWGGDATIRHIRSIPIPPSAIELTFADKFSMCMIDTQRYVEADERQKEELAEKFYSDVFVFLQNGCSSPRALVWIGQTLPETVEKFWRNLDEMIQRKHPEISSATVMDKFVASCSMAIDLENTHLIGIGESVQRISIQTLEDIRPSLHCGGGLFYELQVDSLEELENSFFDKKIQTISYFGFSADIWREWLIRSKPRGIDRIVPVGKALEFSKIWDGFDLLEAFSRRIEVL